MKQKKEELDVDFIGGEGALTVEEEKARSAYFQQKNWRKKLPTKKRTKQRLLLKKNRLRLRDEFGWPYPKASTNPARYKKCHLSI